jgi:hypothetical protein
VPWKECNQMDERLKFIARLLDGENARRLARLASRFSLANVRGSDFCQGGNRRRIQRLSITRCCL